MKDALVLQWEQDPEFQRLTPDEKAEILSNYFDDKLTDDEFRDLPVDEQDDIRKNFVEQNFKISLPDATEQKFQSWYGDYAQKHGLSNDPDAYEQHYDYRKAFLNGAQPNEEGHLPSQFKLPYHPNRYVDGRDTLTESRGPNDLSPEEEKTVAQNIGERGEFNRGVRSGLSQMEGSLGAAAGIGGDLLGIDQLKEWGLKKYQEKEREARLNPSLAPEFHDIDSLKGAKDWTASTLGNLVPSVAEGMASAIAATAVGSAVAPGPGTAAGAITGFLGRKFRNNLIKDWVEGQVAKGVTKEAAEKTALEMAEKMGQDQINKMALKSFAGKAGVVAGTLPLEAGGNYGEVWDRYGQEAPLSALMTGTASAFLELAGGNIRLIDKFLGKKVASEAAKAVEKKDSGLVAKIFKEAMTEAPQEFAQEAGQEFSSLVNIAVNDPSFELLSKESLTRIGESGMAGALGGAVFGGGGALAAAPIEAKDRKRLPLRGQPVPDQGAKPVLQQPAQPTESPAQPVQAQQPEPAQPQPVAPATTPSDGGPVDEDILNEVAAKLKDGTETPEHVARWLTTLNKNGLKNMATRGAELLKQHQENQQPKPAAPAPSPAMKPQTAPTVPEQPAAPTQPAAPEQKVDLWTMTPDQMRSAHAALAQKVSQTKQAAKDTLAGIDQQIAEVKASGGDRAKMQELVNAKNQLQDDVNRQTAALDRAHFQSLANLRNDAKARIEEAGIADKKKAGKILNEFMTAMSQDAPAEIRQSFGNQQTEQILTQLMDKHVPADQRQAPQVKEQAQPQEEQVPEFEGEPIQAQTPPETPEIAPELAKPQETAQVPVQSVLAPEAAQMIEPEKIEAPEATSKAVLKEPTEQIGAEAPEAPEVGEEEQPAPEIAPVVQEEKGKEPWEMTREEWNEVKRESSGYYNLSPEKQRHIDNSDTDGPRAWGREYDSEIEKALMEGKSIPVKNLPAWAITAKESAQRSDDIFDQTFVAQHREQVATALSEGKPVPPEVLKDYPDLAEQNPTITPERKKLPNRKETPITQPIEQSAPTIEAPIEKAQPASGPSFASYDEAQDWVREKVKANGGNRNDFLASDEYRAAFPQIQELHAQKVLEHKTRADDAMKEEGIGYGDRVQYDYVHPWGATTYSGTVVNRKGFPHVKLDSGQKTMAGKKSVGWHRGFRKVGEQQAEEKPEAPTPVTVEKAPEGTVAPKVENRHIYAVRRLLDEVKQGRPGGRIFHDDKTVSGYSSTYPDFMRNKGWTRREVETALHKGINGKPLTPKQHVIFDSALDQAKEEHYKELESSLVFYGENPETLVKLTEEHYQDYIEDLKNEEIDTGAIEALRESLKTKVQGEVQEEVDREETYSPEATNKQLLKIALEEWDAMIAEDRAAQEEAAPGQGNVAPTSPKGVKYSHEEEKDNLSNREGGGVYSGGEVREAEGTGSIPGGGRTSQSSNETHPQVEAQKVASQDVSLDAIHSTEDAAIVARDLITKYPQENFISILVGKNGEILSVYRHTVGTTSATQIQASVLVGQALNTKGVERAWLAHNHPSGNATLSFEDQATNAALENLFQGTDIEPGFLVVTPKAYSFIDDTLSFGADLNKGKTNIPIVERIFVQHPSNLFAVRFPNDVQSYAKDHDIESGILFLDRQNQIVGTVQVDNYSKLRGKQQTEILKAAERTNATYMIVYEPNRAEITLDAAKNICRFGKASGLKVLDIFDSQGSMVNQGTMPDVSNETTAFLRASNQYGFPSGLPASMIEDVASRIKTHWKNGPVIHVVQSVKDLPDHLKDYLLDSGAENQVQGLFDRLNPDTIYLIADNISSEAVAEKTLLHETFGHYGPENVLGRRGEQFFSHVFRSYYGKDLRAFREAKRKGTKPDKNNLVAIAERYDLDLKDSKAARTAAREKLAAMAETNDNPTLLRRFYRVVRNWLRQMGFKLTLTDEDLRGFLADTRKVIEQGTRKDLQAARRGVEPLLALQDQDKSGKIASMTSKKGAGDIPPETTPKPAGGEPKWYSFDKEKRKKFYDPEAIRSAGFFEIWDFDENRWWTFKDFEAEQRFRDKYPLTTLSDNPAAPEKEWFRFGKLPENNRSINYAENKGEYGVSVYATPQGNNPFFAERDIYTGPGRQIGWGSDGEPLIIPTGEWKKFSPNQSRPPSTGGRVSPTLEPLFSLKDDLIGKVFSAAKNLKKKRFTGAERMKLDKDRKALETDPNDTEQAEAVFSNAPNKFVDFFLTPDGNLDLERIEEEMGVLLKTNNPKDIYEAYSWLATGNDLGDSHKEIRQALEIQAAREALTHTLTSEDRDWTEDYFTLPKKSLEKTNRALVAGDQQRCWWKNKVLKERFKLDETEIKGYRAFVVTLDRKLDGIASMMLDAIMGKHGAALVPKILKLVKKRNAQIRAHKPKDLADLYLMEALQELKIDVPGKGKQATELPISEDAVGKILDIANFMQEMRGYVPHTWKSEWVVKVKDLDDQEWLLEVPTWKGKILPARKSRENAAMKAAEKLLEEKFGRNAQGKLKVQTYRLVHSRKLPMELSEDVKLSAMMSIMNASIDRAMADWKDVDASFQEDIREHLTNAAEELYLAKGFGKHFIHRKGVLGYREDLENVLPEYLFGFNAYVAKGEAAQKFAKVMENISPGDTPKLWKYMKDYIGDMLGEAQEMNWYKQICGFFFLAADVSAATLNMTQNFTHAVPLLHGIKAKTLAEKDIVKAMKDVTSEYFNCKKQDKHLFEAKLESFAPDELALMEKAYRQGDLDPQFFGEVTGLHTNKIYLDYVHRGYRALYWAFTGAEALNRMSTLLAAYRRYKDSGVENADAKAIDLMKAAHFPYGKANRPRWVRGLGKYGNIPFTFMAYPMQNLTFLKRLVRSAVQGEERASRVIGAHLAYMFALGGAAGLPFWWLAQFVWGLFNDPEDDPENIAHRVLGDNLGRAAYRGIPATLGVDLSWRMQGTDVFGVPIGLQTGQTIYKRLKGGVQAFERGEYVRGIFQAMPDLLRNPYQAFLGATEGGEGSGRPAIPFDAAQTVIKGLGFTPTEEAEKQKAMELSRAKREEHLDKLEEFAEKYLIHKRRKESENIAELRREVAEYNREQRAKGKEGVPIEWKSVLRSARQRTKQRGKSPAKRLPEYMEKYQNTMEENLGLEGGY